MGDIRCRGTDAVVVDWSEVLGLPGLGSTRLDLYELRTDIERSLEFYLEDVCQRMLTRANTFAPAFQQVLIDAAQHELSYVSVRIISTLLPFCYHDVLGIAIRRPRLPSTS